MTYDRALPQAAATRGLTLFRALALTALAALAIALTGASSAIAAPAATTSPASKVTATTATLNGKVTPDQNGTTYYFQYGTTTNYGTQTPSDAVNGNPGKEKDVSADATGLAPSTTYHFRVVATNGGGTTFGADMTFITAAPGPGPGPAQNTVTIAASPKTITFGGATTIAGQVNGAGNGGVQVTLEENPFPYTGGFKATSMTVTTSATGAYSLSVKPGLNTRYRVSAKTKPPVTSPEVTVTVRVKVTFAVSDSTPAVNQLVRFSGTVTPAHNGKLALIQKRTSAGGWKTVTSTALVASTPVNGVARSKFSKRLRIKTKGTYRVRVTPGDGDHAAGTSRTRTLPVH